MAWISFLRSAGKSPAKHCFALSKTKSLKEEMGRAIPTERILFKQNVNLKDKRTLIAQVVDEFERHSAKS